MNRKPVLLVVITAVIIIGALAVVLVNGNYFGGNHASTGSGLNCNAFSKITKVGGNASSNPEDSNVTFLIVEADTGPFEGMNGSAYHLEVPWPVINVHQNQTVVIHIFNCASSEQHGLAITHYFNEGVILQPDQILHLDIRGRSEGNVCHVLQYILRNTSLHAEWKNHSELNIC